MESVVSEKLQAICPVRIHLAWHENRSSYLTYRKERGSLYLRLHRLFLTAPSPVLEALILYTLKGDKAAGRLVGQMAHLYFSETKVPPASLSPKGQVYDLIPIYESTKKLYFSPDFSLSIGYNKYQKALPFGTTFFQPTPQCIRLEHPISSYRDEKETRKKIPRFKLSAKPNVYLFVIETLRRDYVDREIAPNLSRFGESNISFSSSFANANWTPLSWFAIFHSDFPYHWTAMRDNWKGGSIPLSIFKKMGYKVKIYSSADLRYFDMDKVLFGEKRELGDRIEEFSFDHTIEPCDRDELCIQSFERDLLSPEGREGNLYIFFFDSTHSEYSFPKDAPLKFEPIAKKIDYLTLTPKEIEPVKNRYRNSIYFVDSLLGRFFNLLERESLYEKAIIACTGDHGEEFYEEGALFHGTHLNKYQTAVPIFFKLPGKTALTSSATHVDIFPTLLHTLTGHSDFSALLDGQSVLKERLWPYRIAVLQNGPDTPCEFSIENEEAKLQARFLTPRDIYHQTELEIVELRLPTSDDQGSLEEKLEKYFPKALDPLLN